MYKNKTQKQIFLLFVCDEHCSTYSQRPIMATTSKTKLKLKISELIELGDFEYNNPEWDRKRQSSSFKKDFDKGSRTDINSLLKYGFIDYCYDGEQF